MKVIVHYSEIGIKGSNRSFFEKALMDNLKIKGFKPKKVKGRIICEEKNVEALKSTPGIAYFSPCEETKLDLEEIKQTSLKILSKKSFETFKVVTNRFNKNFPMTSPEVDKIIGEVIVTKMDKKVDVRKPEVKLYIELCDEKAYIYADREEGMGGLPIGSSEKLACSLSGGIDSPVSSYLMMKRGSRVIFVHIHNDKQKIVLEKISELVTRLSKVQGGASLYIVPFSSLQEEIINKCPGDYRMIIYRRYMMKIINKIAVKEKAKGIITGDNLGQVASQTLTNMKNIWEASKLPIISPLMGFNKDEIIILAKKIGTFDTSIKPYPDCCSFMISKHPQTKSDIEEIMRIEEGIDEKLIDNCLKKSILKKF